MSYVNANAAHVAADAVAQLLWRLETQLDEAFATGGELLAALPRARSAANLPAIAGQQAFEVLSQAIVAIGAARGHAVAGHRIVEKVGKQIGYETSFGDEKPKPEFAPTGVDASHLRVAA
jgi:phosphate/sulfate permease